jgi:7-cyano-7-deazaguanine synthase in queuosine biosynthesis
MQVAHFKPYREHSLPMPFLSVVQPAGSGATSISDPRVPAAVAPQLIELLPLLSAAVRFAVHYQAAAIYLGLRIGGHGDELAQATEYIQIWNEMIQLPCGQSELEVMTPLLELETWQVVDVGFQVNAPFERTWSCAEESSDPCWACRGCRARESAFQQAGKADPMRVVRKL